MKKKLLKKLMVLALSAVTAFSAVPAATVTAAGNPYPTTQDVDRDGLYEIPCTRFAWQCVYDRQGIALPSWGNAVNWWQNAINQGYAVGNEPVPGSIAVWSGDYYGHVAYVPCSWPLCDLCITLRYLYHDHSCSWLPCRLQLLRRCDGFTFLILTSGSTEDMAYPSAWNCSIHRILCCIPFCHQEI